MSTQCLFCKIVEGSIPSQKILETSDCLAFKDVSPQAPFHVLVVPKKHIPSLNDMTAEDRATILPKLFDCADKIATEQEFRKEGYRTVINNQTIAGQTVFHLHLHVLGGAKLRSFG